MSKLRGIYQSLAEVIGSASVPMLAIGGQTFTVHMEGNKKIVSELDGDSGAICCRVVIIDINPKISKIYYESKYDPNSDEGLPPTCFSEDGEAPAKSANKPQSDKCRGCAHNEFGTAISDFGGKGKACRDVIKMAIIVPKFSMDTPLQFRVPPASLKNFLAYMAKFDEAKMGVDEVATYIYFEPDKTGVVNFAPARFEGDEKLLSDKFYGTTAMLTGTSNAPKALEAPKSEEPKKIAKQEIEEPKKKEPKKTKPKFVESEKLTVDEEVKLPNMKGISTKPKTSNRGIPETNAPEGMKEKLASIMNMPLD